MNELIFESLREVFEIQTPFSSFLGIKILGDDTGTPYLRLEMQQVCIGNYMQNILHGGVISTMLDIMGAVTAMSGVLTKHPEYKKADMLKRFEKLGTIDLRVDYLRPGWGEFFIATGESMRIGNKVCVARTELKNNENTLIAVGTGTYMVG